MSRKLSSGIVIIALLLMSGCMNKEIEVFYEEKERLTNEILDLKKQISEQDKKIDRLEKDNSNKRAQLRELTESLYMIRASSYDRLDDYNNSFGNLQNIYKINSNHVIKDDWYIINEDYFQIELLEYKSAKSVNFYTLRSESDQGPILIFKDIDSTDGWVYTNDDIGQIINKHIKHFSGGLSYEPRFVIYAEVILENGSILRTSKLPIYNK